MRIGDQYRDRAVECMRAVGVVVETARKIALLELSPALVDSRQRADLAGENSLLAGRSPSRARH